MPQSVRHRAAPPLVHPVQVSIRIIHIRFRSVSLRPDTCSCSSRLHVCFPRAAPQHTRTVWRMFGITLKHAIALLAPLLTSASLVALSPHDCCVVCTRTPPLYCRCVYYTVTIVVSLQVCKLLVCSTSSVCVEQTSKLTRNTSVVRNEYAKTNFVLKSYGPMASFHKVIIKLKSAANCQWARNRERIRLRLP